MFSGIITDIGKITDLDRSDSKLRIAVACNYEINSLTLGNSIACSGICLTITDIKTDQSGKSLCYFDISHETLANSTASRWQKGQHINLERALKLGDELGGHLVSGHVDAVAHVTDIQRQDNDYRVLLTPPKQLMPYIASKGSITLDGVSLTVNKVSALDFEIMLIPYTFAHTTLGELSVGQAINVEIDLFARYISRLKQYESQQCE